MKTENEVIVRIKAFEERYMTKFTPSHKMCEKLGIQLRRVKKIVRNELEPTIYETMALRKFLQLPSRR